MEKTNTLSRRMFVKLAGAAGAASLVSPGYAFEAAKKRKFKIGSTFILWGYGADNLEPALKDMSALGYHSFETFGGVIEDWESELSTGSLQERYQTALASMACHSAVRSGRRMELPEIQRLLEDWRQTGLPTTCPHGRRIAMRLTIEDLDRIFGRQGWT